MGHGSRTWYDDATPPASVVLARSYIVFDAVVRSSSRAPSRSASSRMRAGSMRTGAVVAMGPPSDGTRGWAPQLPEDVCEHDCDRDEEDRRADHVHLRGRADARRAPDEERERDRRAGVE